MTEGFSRRKLLPTTAAALVVPRHVLGGQGYTAPSDKLNVAGVGIGGNICRSHFRGLVPAGAGCNIVALCDVDERYSVPTYKTYPDARRYIDFRRMLEKEHNSFDGVYIATPDHNHAIVAMAAMQLGKHVLCVKPLARTVHECRTLARAAKEAGVATQVTASSRVSEPSMRVYEMIWGGAIGPVREVHAWCNRPIWPQGIARPKQTPPVPDGLHWDLWLGPSPERPYHPAYHPWIWRGWWDFGTGSLGDMGCHFFNSMFKALKIGQPTRVQAVSTVHHRRPDFDYPSGNKKILKAKLPETAPASAILTWDFPAREDMPPVRVRWYDGGLKPPAPEELGPDAVLPDNGILYVGDDGKIMSSGSRGGALIPESRAKAYGEPPRTLERCPWAAANNVIQEEWVAACKGGPTPSCNFEVAAHLTEVALLGNIATRTSRQLVWDGNRFTNSEEANGYLNEPYRAGWKL